MPKLDISPSDRIFNEKALKRRDKNNDEHDDAVAGTSTSMITSPNESGRPVNTQHTMPHQKTEKQKEGNIIESSTENNRVNNVDNNDDYNDEGGADNISEMAEYEVNPWNN